MSNPTSEQWRNLVNNVRAKDGRGKHKVFSPLVKALGRSTFDRMADGQLDVTDRAVKLLANCLVRIEGLDRKEILSCLHYGPDPSMDPKLITLVHSTVFRENTKNLPELNKVLEKYDNFQGLMLGWGSLPIRHQCDGILDAMLESDQRRLGFTKAHFTAQRAWRQQRLPEFLSNYRPGKTQTHLGLTEECINEVETQTGSCAGADPMDAYFQFKHLTVEVVKDRGQQLSIIKNRLSGRMRKLTAGLVGIYACVPYFLMMIPKGGGVRIFFEKTRDRYGNQLLEKKIHLLQELLTHTIHGDSPTASSELLDQKMSPMLDLKKRVKSDHFEEMEHNEEKNSKTDFDLPGYKVHLPR